MICNWKDLTLPFCNLEVNTFNRDLIKIQHLEPLKFISFSYLININQWNSGKATRDH